MKPVNFLSPYIRKRKRRNKKTFRFIKESQTIDSDLPSYLGPIAFSCVNSITIDLTNTIWDTKTNSNSNWNATFKKKFYKDHRIFLHYKLAAAGNYWPNYKGKYSSPDALLLSSIASLPSSAGIENGIWSQQQMQALLNLSLLINKSNKLKTFSEGNSVFRILKFTNRTLPVQVLKLVSNTVVPIVNPWALPQYQLLDKDFTYLVAAYCYLTRGFKVYTDLEFNLGSSIKGYPIDRIRIKLLVPDLKLAFLDPDQAFNIDSEIGSLAVLKTVRNRLSIYFNLNYENPYRHYSNLKFNCKYLCSWEQRQDYIDKVNQTNSIHDNKWMGVSPKSFISLNSLPFIHYVPFNSLITNQ
jgi:hypothetical protein